MPLVTSKELLKRAQAEGFAVGAFNANNMECVQAVIETAEEEQSPVILQVSQGAIAYAGLEFATMLVKTAAELATVPVVLHLDHGTDFLQNVRCLRAGFTSLMFDGSSLPLDENIKITRKITEIAHAVGVPVEAELGKIPKVEDNLTQEQVDNLMADPEQAQRFVEETDCDSMAVAIGSVHGMKESIQPLNIERLDEIKQRTGLPLVLHGASGVLCTRADAAEKGVKLESHQGTLEDAIKHGISKVNVATELSMAYLRGMKEAFETRPGEKDMRKIMLPGKNAVKEVVRYYIKLFGSNGKAGRNGAVSGLTASEIKYHE
ncbi:MAG TPA: class II fructose-bisphosphate aldolase [Armatimonadota bacterium]|nr:class II fructose-bisphosphate aldolase [Armatimonadota bacterium]